MDVMWKRNGKWLHKQGCHHPVPCTSPAPSCPHSPTPGCSSPQVTPCLPAGTYYQTTDRGEVRGDLFTLTLPNVSMTENGVYSATFMGDSPLWSAFYRLIVRGEWGQGSGTPLSPPTCWGRTAQCQSTSFCSPCSVCCKEMGSIL